MSTFAVFHNVRILALLPKLLILNRAFIIISLICIRLYKGHIVTYQEIVFQHAATLELCGVKVCRKIVIFRVKMGVNQGGGHIQNQLRQLKKECYLECQLGKGILQQKYDENPPSPIFRDFSILPGFL